MNHSQNNVVPYTALVELARRAKAVNDPHIQQTLLAYAVTKDPGLARALLMRLELRAAIELLDPFPFDTPAEEEFV